MNYKHFKNQSIKIVGNRAYEFKAINRLTWKELFEILDEDIEKIDAEYLYEPNQIEKMKETNLNYNLKYMDKIKINRKIEKIDIEYLNESIQIEKMKETNLNYNLKYMDEIKEIENIKIKIKKENDEEQILKIIEEANIKDKPLDLIFNKSQLKYESIKEAVFNKINNYPNITELFVKITFIHEDKTKHRIYSIETDSTSSVAASSVSLFFI